MLRELASKYGDSPEPPGIEIGEQPQDARTTFIKTLQRIGTPEETIKKYLHIIEEPLPEINVVETAHYLMTRGYTLRDLRFKIRAGVAGGIPKENTLRLLLMKTDQSDIK